MHRDACKDSSSVRRWVKHEHQQSNMLWSAKNQWMWNQTAELICSWKRNKGRHFGNCSITSHWTSWCRGDRNPEKQESLLPASWQINTKINVWMCSTELLQYHNVEYNKFQIYSVADYERRPKIMAHTTSIRQYSTASHHVPKKTDWTAPRSK